MSQLLFDHGLETVIGAAIGLLIMLCGVPLRRQEGRVVTSHGQRSLPAAGKRWAGGQQTWTPGASA